MMNYASYFPTLLAASNDAKRQAQNTGIPQAVIALSDRGTVKRGYVVVAAVDAERFAHQLHGTITARYEGGEVRTKAKYADPGYQSDGKPRYILTTERHVRAAWAYINRPAYARRYTREQLRHIHERIQAAGRRYGIQFGHARAKAPASGRVTDRAARRRGER